MLNYTGITLIKGSPWGIAGGLNSEQPSLLFRATRGRYSITSSARNKSDAGIDRFKAVAVRMLSTNSNFVGRSIGSSGGFAPANDAG